jgi:hypothetical protein
VRFPRMAFRTSCIMSELRVGWQEDRFAAPIHEKKNLFSRIFFSLRVVRLEPIAKAMRSTPLGLAWLNDGSLQPSLLNMKQRAIARPFASTRDVR